MKAKRHDLGFKQQSLEETIMSSDHGDHIDITSALCKTIKPLFKIRRRERIILMFDID